jgi:hypothetical protein
VTVGGLFFHYELFRSGGKINLFCDGGQTATASNSTNFNSVAMLEIDRQSSAYLDNHIDEFRFSAGIARHTACDGLYEHALTISRERFEYRRWTR